MEIDWKNGDKLYNYTLHNYLLIFSRFFIQVFIPPPPKPEVNEESENRNPRKEAVNSKKQKSIITFSVPIKAIYGNTITSLSPFNTYNYISLHNNPI